MSSTRVLICVILLVIAFVAAAQGDVCRLINYQGILRDLHGVPIGGQHDLIFSIYADSSLTAVHFWSEKHQDVQIDEGLFNVILGRKTPIPENLFAGAERWLGIAVDTDPEMQPRMRMTSVPWALRAAVAESLATGGGSTGWVITGDDMYADVLGNVGIGTTSPDRDLEIEGAFAALRLSSTRGGPSLLELKGPMTNPLSSVRGKIRFLNSSNAVLGGIRYVSNGLRPDEMIFNAGASDHMWLTAQGKLGLGTNVPAANLEIKGDQPTLRLTADPATHGPILELKGAAGGMAVWVYGGIHFMDASANVKGQITSFGGVAWPPGIAISAGSNLGIKITESGNVGIGTHSPSRPLTVRGNILVENETTGDPVAEIGEGLDYAEGFDISSVESIEPGAVLVIDPENPGKLTTTTLPYDTRVAGIAAGANGLGSGVRLGVDQFDCDVALAGRVFCNVDATQHAIEPGDLLTTSEIRGYAMKATDYEAAQGAILGKAMETLELGEKGRIMVLVTLQ